MSLLGLIPYLLAFALGAGSAGWGAWNMGRAPLKGDIADLRAQYADLRETNAESARLAALAASNRLSAAQAAGHAAEQRLADTLALNARLSKEKRDALAAATTGRVCLADAALGVLDGSPGIRVARAHDGDRLSAPTGAVAAAPGSIATDTHVAQWISEAGDKFEACRAQLHELIDVHVPGQGVAD